MQDARFTHVRAALRTAPDAAAAQVLADIRHEAGDPWGELPAAAARGGAREWLAAHAELVRARWGEARLGLHDGLVTAVECELDALPPPEAFAAEPLAVLRLVVGKEADDERIAAALRDWRGPPLFGLALGGTFRPAACKTLSAALPRLGLASLDLAGAACKSRVTLPPRLRLMACARVPEPQDDVERLALRRVTPLPLTLLRWPRLRTLDLRGSALSDRQLRALRAWAVDGRQVIHEAFSLDEQGPWARRGAPHAVRWPPPRQPEVAVSTAGELDYVVADGRTLRGYLSDAPAWKTELSHPVRSLASTPSAHHVLDTAGVVHRFSRQGAPLASTPAPATRALVVDGDAVLHHEAERLLLADGRRAIAARANAFAVALDGLSAAAVDDAGVLTVYSGETLTDALARPGAEDPRVMETRRFGAPLLAVAALPRGAWAVATAEELWLVDGVQPPTLLGLQLDGERALLAARDGWIAWSAGEHHVVCWRLDASGKCVAQRDTHWSSTFSNHPEPLWLQALAMASGGMTLAALSCGALNLLDGETGAALRADPHPGERARGWIFIHDGKILM